MIKRLEKGSWEERLKEFSLTKRKMRGWLNMLQLLKRIVYREEGGQVHIRREKLGLYCGVEDLEGSY